MGISLKVTNFDTHLKITFVSIQVLVPLTARLDRHVVIQTRDVRSVTGRTTGDNVNIVCNIKLNYEPFFNTS